MKPGNRRICAMVPIPAEFFCEIREDYVCAAKPLLIEEVLFFYGRD